MGFSRVSLLKSEVVGQTPTASAMASGELAVNYADKKIYGKHPGSGAVVQVAAAPTHSHALSDLSQSGATSGQVPTWNGTAWTPQTPSGGSGPATPSDSYTEPTFTGGVLTSMTTWSDSTKTALVETKTFSYTAGNLTQITTTDATGTTTLTKNITYSGGNLASLTEDYA
jgi:hypothetical protein